jgi:hypothetical protein
MLSRPTRAVLDNALQKYRPGRSDPFLVGGISLLKPALRLMMSYRLMIQDVAGSKVLTSYTRWPESRTTEGRRKSKSLRSIQPAKPPRMTKTAKVPRLRRVASVRLLVLCFAPKRIAPPPAVWIGAHNFNVR